MISAAPPPNHRPPISSTLKNSETVKSSPAEHFSAGRCTVVGMLFFGVGLVGALWWYWDQYTRPFRPLQQAIVQAYPSAQAYVVGGKAKSHLDLSPNTLRIVLQVAAEENDPETHEAESLNRSIELFRLAERHQDLKPYQELEVHLVQLVPERPSRVWSLRLPIPEWYALTPVDTSVTH